MNCRGPLRPSMNVILWILALFALILFLVATFSSCATIKLERQLDPSIRKWYEVHRHIMEHRVPNYVSSTKMTERRYFLELPLPLQKR